MSDAPAELAWREVVALHDFFVRWFCGAPDAPDFADCERAFAPDFRMIGPDGVTHLRAAVVERLRGAYASQPASFSIAVSDPHVVSESGGDVLLEYTERQYRDGRTTFRRSTALFQASPTAPRGVLWRHLQETWMDKDEGDRG